MRPFGTHGLRIYFYYGIASIVLTALFIGMSLLGWFRTIRGIVGDTITWMIVGALALYVLYQLVSFSYRLLALRLAPAVEAPVHPPLKHFSNAPHDG
ncbi:hypothetical protein [Thermogemmatispora tikiterensis]|nr:hypothetical protein [Thermogemmatispora tikiterensis]